MGVSIALERDAIGAPVRRSTAIETAASASTSSSSAFRVRCAAATRADADPAQRNGNELRDRPRRGRELRSRRALLRPALELPLLPDGSSQAPNEGVLPYDLNTPLFSDYASKHRFVWLPPGTAAMYDEHDSFEFPVGTVIIKTFAYFADARDPSLGERLLETRLIVHRDDGWYPITYLWNDEETEARRRIIGKRIPVTWIDLDGETRSINYQVPNTNQCHECHDVHHDTLGLLGPKARNLNKDYAYPGGTANQLEHWTEVGLLTGAPALFRGAARRRVRRSRDGNRRAARAHLPRRQLRQLPQRDRPGPHLRTVSQHRRDDPSASASARRRWRRGKARAIGSTTSCRASPTNRSSSSAWNPPKPESPCRSSGARPCTKRESPWCASGSPCSKESARARNRRAASSMGKSSSTARPM